MNNFLNTYPECFEHPDAVFQSAGCNQMYVVVHDFECYQMDFGSLARGFGQHPHGGVQLMGDKIDIQYKILINDSTIDVNDITVKFRVLGSVVIFFSFISFPSIHLLRQNAVV